MLRALALLTAATGLAGATPVPRNNDGAAYDPQASWFPEANGFFVNNTIWRSYGNQSLTYPRFVELFDGTILATSAFSGNSPPFFPIFESKNGGASWEYISNLTDTQNGVGFGSQPALTQLTFPLGKYPNGTILGTGNSAGPNFTRIDLYASTDGARTWEFVSRIAEGGKANTTNGATPIWEPTLLPYDGQLVAYYSDQRDPDHGQKLSHQVSTDMLNWGPVVDDVAYDDYLARPGMTNIVYLPPIDKWMLVHENPRGNSSSYGVNYPVFYVLADSPLEFGQNVDTPLVVNNTLAPNASPYIAWSPLGGPNGTIVVSDADNMGVFTNQNGGDIDSWELHATPAGSVYSRSIQIFKCMPDHLLIYGGDNYNGRQRGEHLPFSATVVNLNDVLASGPYLEDR